MDYHEAANFLFDLRRYPPRPGTESTGRLLEHLGRPQEGVRFVQIAGSNGKGSTARMVERILREAGYDVGLYTSPHMDDIRERVRVNGRPISETAVIEFAEAAHQYVTERAEAERAEAERAEAERAEAERAEAERAEETDDTANGDGGGVPTFFETTTALAVWAFGRADVDVGVLEVGIGGRYDATSVVDPEASAVTSVALEHADVLGDTVEEIARDKAHVAPDDNPLVTATDGAVLRAIREVAGDVLVVGDGTGAAAEEPGVRVTYEGREGLEGVVALAGPDWTVETRLALLGAHQARNAGVAAAIARQIGGVSEDDVARGLRRAHLRGRFEVIDREPMVVLDSAHNPGGCESLASTLSEFEYDELHVVFAALVDKDHRGMAEALPDGRVITCRPTVERAEDPDVLAARFRAAGYDEVEAGGTVEAAVEDALAGAGPDDCVLVAGSLYAVAAARRRWSRVVIPTRVETVADGRAAMDRANVPATGPDDQARPVAESVHRVLRTRLQRPLAHRLAEELRSLGGRCAISGVRDHEEPVDVVLMGTVSQLQRLATAIDGGSPVGSGGETDANREGETVARPDGLRVLADEIREASVAGTGPGSRVGPGDLTTSRQKRTRSIDDSHDVPWKSGTAVMGVLNVTPDSFHDGGRYRAASDAVGRAEEMLDAGADILDVGGESTRPGADPVPAEEERSRVLPVLDRLADADALVSIDTRKPDVARAALEAGADILNDVSGLEDPEMARVAADYDVPVVVMHSIATPVDPDRTVEYDDVVETVVGDLAERVLRAERAGLDRSEIIVDPGLGFGKTARENFALLDRLDELRALGCPVLVGHSHKSMFELAGARPGDAFHETIAATALAADRGADIIRVHDVRENVQAVRVARLTGESEYSPDG